MSLDREQTEEVLFENVFTPTKALFREYANCLCSRGTIPLYVLSLAFALNVAMDTLSLLFWQENFRGWEPFSGFLMAAVFCFFVAKLGRWRILKTLVKQEQLWGSGTFRERRFWFYDKGIQTSGAPDTIFPYEKISKIVDADECVYVVIEKLVGIPIKKNSFVKGDYESFIRFLGGKLGARQNLMKSYRKRKRRIAWIICACGIVVLLLIPILVSTLVGPQR